MAREYDIILKWADETLRGFGDKGGIQHLSALQESNWVPLATLIAACGAGKVAVKVVRKNISSVRVRLVVQENLSACLARLQEKGVLVEGINNQMLSQNDPKELLALLTAMKHWHHSNPVAKAADAKLKKGVTSMADSGEKLAEALGEARDPLFATNTALITAARQRKARQRAAYHAALEAEQAAADVERKAAANEDLSQESTADEEARAGLCRLIDSSREDEAVPQCARTDSLEALHSALSDAQTDLEVVQSSRMYTDDEIRGLSVPFEDLSAQLRMAERTLRRAERNARNRPDPTTQAELRTAQKRLADLRRHRMLQADVIRIDRSMARSRT